MSNIVYFSKMFQAVPHLAQVQQVLPGTFVSNRRSTLKAMRRLYPKLAQERYGRLLKYLSTGYRLLDSADVIVTGSPYKTFLQPYHAKKCMVFHGTYMMLSQATMAENSHFDLLCSIGPRMQQMMARFATDKIMSNVVNTGFLPFCEFPQATPEQHKNTLHRLGLSPEKKTVLYTPSRRGVGSWEEVAEVLVKTAPHHFNLILRPHPNQSLTSRSKDRDSFKRVAALAQQRPHTMLDLTESPLPLLLSIAELIVSDANSPAEEALFYDTPQLFIETDKFSRRIMQEQAENEGMHPHDTEQLLSLYDCGPCYRATSKLSFESTLDSAIAERFKYASQRKSYFSWVFGKLDHNANIRVADAIRQRLL